MIYPYLPPADIQIIQDCAEHNDILFQDMYALCWKESSCRWDTIGDGGDSKGAFQINERYHFVPSQWWEKKMWQCQAAAKYLKQWRYKEDSIWLRFWSLRKYRGYYSKVNKDDKNKNRKETANRISREYARDILEKSNFIKLKTNSR